MDQLRIAVYHHLHSGGAKRVVTEQVSRLQFRHNVALFSLTTADHRFAVSDCRLMNHTSLQTYRPLAYLKSPLGRLNPLVGMLNLSQLNLLAWQVARHIDSQGFDVVLAHPCQVTQAPLILSWLRTPSLYYCHELPRHLYEPALDRPYIRSERIRLLADKIIRCHP